MFELRRRRDWYLDQSKESGWFSEIQIYRTPSRSLPSRQRGQGYPTHNQELVKLTSA